MKRFLMSVVCLAYLALAGNAIAEENKALKTVLKDNEVRGAWIYNDLNAGFAEAKKSNKPLLIVFR